MCSPWCTDFARQALAERHVERMVRPKVLEVGSRNVNGSVRNEVFSHYTFPYDYLGIDVEAGPGVDRIVNVEEMNWEEEFDIIVCTEVLEHVHDWRRTLKRMLHALKVGGILILTTRSPGFEYHPYPEDNWRFTQTDMHFIFAGFPKSIQLEEVQPDPDKRGSRSCGVGIVVRRTGADLHGWEAWLPEMEVMDVHKDVDQNGPQFLPGRKLLPRV